MDRSDIKNIFKKTVKVLMSHDLYAGASQLAYSLIMAIIPLIMFVITLAGKLTLPIDDIYAYIKFLLPTQAYDAVIGIINEIINSSNLTFVTLLVSIYFISIGSRGLMRVTNRAYHSLENRTFFRFLITSFIFAILLVLMFIVTLGGIVFGKVILNGIDNLFSHFFTEHFLLLLSYLRYIITFLFLGMVFSGIYAVAPNTRLHLKDVYIGGYSAALLWIMGSSLFAYYINHFNNYGLLFGSLGGIFILLAWLYLTSLIILLGAYLNANIYYFKTGQKETTDTECDPPQ